MDYNYTKNPVPLLPEEGARERQEGERVSDWREESGGGGGAHLQENLSLSK